MSHDDDDLYEEFGDLLCEVPEAEEALRRYRERRQRQSLAAVCHMAAQKEQLADEAAWEDLRHRLNAAFVSNAVD